MANIKLQFFELSSLWEVLWTLNQLWFDAFRICRKQFWSGNMYLCWSDDFDLSSFCSIWRNFSNGEFRIPPFRSIFDSRSSPCVRSPCKDVPVSKYNVRPWKYYYWYFRVLQHRLIKKIVYCPKFTFFILIFLFETTL